ncbi:MAG: transglycosylase SLT domain-containing protein [Pseudomonadales bacterium]
MKTAALRLTCIALLTALSSLAGAIAPLASWQEVVRQSPYWESQGAHANLATIRRWVLGGEAYCTQQQRHILFDRRMRFVGYLSDVGEREANQARIDAQRQQLAEAGRVDAWMPGEVGRIGYPFVLSCYQPDARLGELLARYTGDDETARLWGTWDGMRIGSPEAPVALHEAIRQVFEFRREMGRINLPDHVLSVLAGKVIIESGGQRDALSPAGARGIMQLSTAALNDCEIEPGFHLHRLAQIDCALYLLEQNHRNLAPVFAEHFGHLPENKSDNLYRLLLVQAYHGGVGRVRALMTDDALNGAARYFASHHQRFTAGDIALGMVYHNLGRNRLGFASLYYVTDVSLATTAVCARLDDLPGCA